MVSLSKVPNSFVYRSPLKIQSQETRVVKNNILIPILPPTSISENHTEDTVSSPRYDKPSFPEPLGPLHIEQQNKSYQDFLTPTEASLLEHIETYTSQSGLKDTYDYGPHQVIYTRFLKRKLYWIISTF